MTVYKGYMYVAKKNTGLFLLYLAIFFTTAFLFQFTNQNTDEGEYQAEKLRIAVVDEDHGRMAESLKAYLGEEHEITEVEHEVPVLQEMLYYREINYVIWIPEAFFQTCILDGETLNVTQVPGAYTAVYAEQQINSYLNNARIYAASGFTEAETAEAVTRKAEIRVNLVDTRENGGETPDYIYYFRYLPYLFLGALGYMVGSMVSAMRRGDLKLRMQASAIPQKKQSTEGLLACMTIAVSLFGIAATGAVLLYGKELKTDPGSPYYLLNAAAMLCVAVAISYLTGSLSDDINALNGMVNVVSLGMCFLGGAFVPLEVMNTGVKKAAQFLPVYWFETANELLGTYDLEIVRVKVLQAIGIQFVFAAAFVCITLAVAKRRRTV